MTTYKFYRFDKGEKGGSMPDDITGEVPRVGEIVRYSGSTEYRVTEVTHIVNKRHNSLESVVHVKGTEIK